VLAAVALLILLRDGRPVLFSQLRMGRHGFQFRIWKFRTMRAGAVGSAVTAAGDSRVTITGARLRRYKLDELPQLFNVLRGDMTLIGPRPEVPEYVDGGSRMWQAVLQVKPGITDVATLIYRNEEALLGAARDPDTFYRETLLPAKLCLSLAYLSTRSMWRDLRLVWLTIYCSLSPGRFDPCRIRRAFELGA
jgi:lipopolysaccharide/colanic/teichoic acid biosynthesis glycosyltransferase